MDDIKAVAGQLQEPIFDVQDETPVAYLPPGWQRKDLDDLLPAPLRIKQTTFLNDIESLVEYTSEFMGNNDDPRIFANESMKEITAVLDPTMPGSPSHQSHTATLHLDAAPEWNIWKDFCGKYHERKIFVRFVENNLENIVGDFSGAKILEMCRDLKATSSINVDISEDLEQGIRRLTFGGDQQVRGGKAQVAFPETIKVQLRVFKGDTLFKFEARLRWEMEGDKMFFAIDLRDAEIVEEDAFTQIVEKVKDATQLNVLRGTYK